MNAAPPYPTASQLGRPKSGLLYLRNKVDVYFKEYDVPAEVTPVGLKYRSFNLNQGPGGGNRVVFIPGVFDGATGAPKSRAYGVLSRDGRNASSGGNPRELLSWDRPFTLSLWAAPVLGAKEDEGASLDAAEDLLEQAVRAIVTAAGATVQWGEIIINSPPQENSFGVELLVSCNQIGPILDVTLDVITAKPAVPVKEVT